jgi:hypothetical protein
MNTSLKLVAQSDEQNSSRLELGAGAYAVTTNTPGTTMAGALEVFDANGKLVLRFDPESSQVHLGFSSSTLSVDPRTGDTRLQSTGKLTLQGTDVEVLGQRSAVLGVRGALGQVGASVVVGAHRLAMLTKRLDVRAEREHREIEHSNTHAQSVSVKADNISHQATKLETMAGTMLTKAKEAFAYIEGESRVEANRATWKVAQTLWFRSKRAFLKCDKDVNIDGEKVNLG